MLKNIKPFNKENDFNMQDPIRRVQIVNESLVPLGLYQPLESRLKTFMNNLQSKNPRDSRGGNTG